MIIDTNVVSEAMKGDPEGVIARLLDAYPWPTLAIAAVTVQEVTYGLARMPDGRRKAVLSELWDEIRSGMSDRVLGLDAVTAALAGEILALREAQARPIGLPDAQIAATCLRYSRQLATRNTKDFEGLGIDLVDPWAA
jgi:predicted nucleic acid-binding protein